MAIAGNPRNTSMTPPGPRGWRGIILAPWSATAAVVILLAAYFALAVTSVLNKSVTYDEPVHLAGGYVYWTRGDYRINPENGILPQRWMALPLLAGSWNFPDLNAPPNYDQWMLAHKFLYESGNDVRLMLLLGRSMVALLGVALAAVVYRWSRSLFGTAGGLLSLTLCVFSTALLANGALMTSDLAASLCFLGALGCLWRLLHRVTIFTILCSCLAMGALFVSKMSALLIVPMGLCLLVIRLLNRRPLEVAFVRAGQVGGLVRQAVIYLGMVVLHIAAIYVIIWAFYGFRYAELNNAPPAAVAQKDENFNKVMSASIPGRGIIQFARDHRLLPEAYLHGHAHVLKFSQFRAAFLNGEYSARGWWTFFPYAFLIKTPLSLFVILLLAALAALVGWRRVVRKPPSDPDRLARHSFYRTAPLWVLLAVYWAFAITSKLNIGHRHILPTYPPIFILAGAAAGWWKAWSRGRFVSVLLSAALLAYVAESLAAWPHYLAYFNQLVGGPGNAHRHLVDSSLDWGQDVPGLKLWLDRHGLTGQDQVPVYLSYFGNGNPTYYGITAHRLPGFVDMDIKTMPVVPLRGGVYVISATVLESVLPLNRIGRWTVYYEETYKRLMGDIDEMMKSDQGRASLAEPLWQEYLRQFADLRLGRLCAYLRSREPDDNVGYSLLIYRLSDHDVQQALYGPPTELLPDLIPTKDKLLK